MFLAQTFQGRLLYHQRCSNEKRRRQNTGTQPAHAARKTEVWSDMCVSSVCAPLPHVYVSMYMYSMFQCEKLMTKHHCEMAF